MGFRTHPADPDYIPYIGQYSRKKKKLWKVSTTHIDNSIYDFYFPTFFRRRRRKRENILLSNGQINIFFSQEYCRRRS